MTPWIASGTMSARSTVLTSVAAVVSTGTVAVLRFTQTADPRVAAAPGVAVIFVMVGSAVAITMAVAAGRQREQQFAYAREVMSARKRVAAAETRFRLVTDQVSDLMAVFDDAACCTFATDSFRRVLGKPPEAVLGETVGGLAVEADRAAVAAGFREAFDGETTELVARMPIADGSIRSFHVRMIAADVDGHRHVAVTARDVTELQSLNTELESARRMEALGRLAGGVAHDFNNMLSVIGSCASMVRMSLGPNAAPAEEDLDVIDDAVKRAADLTRQLLSFARRQVLDAGRSTPSEEVRRLEPLLERALGRAVTLAVDTSRSQWQTGMSSGQLEQIVVNLAVNGRDAMPAGGRLEISVDDAEVGDGEVSQLSPGEYVVVRVKDDGTGIPEEVVTRIFEPFFTTKAPGKGTGLGLATAFGIARQLGGTITVESAIGAGSTFRLYVPRQRSAPEAARGVVTPSLSPRPEALRVLVLDDEVSIGALVGRILGTAGHEARAVSSPDEALACARDGSYDVILTDVVLGSADGIEVLSSLRAMQPSAGVVVMSGFSPSPERLAAVTSAGARFLAKPFTVAELLDAVKAAAAQPRSRAPA
jgi:PAS domain S-box-containing protein